MTDSITGYRLVWDRPTIGDTLANSRAWEDDEPTYELQGTCAFATLAQCRKYGQYSKGATIIMIEGEDRGNGDDMDGEIIIADAVVTAIIEVL